MMAKEEAACQAFKDKDAADFQKVADPDMVGVYSDGVSGMQGELDGMKKWNMKSFRISDFIGRADGADVFVTSYKIDVVGSLDRRDASGTYHAGSVWKMKNGQ